MVVGGQMTYVHFSHHRAIAHFFACVNDEHTECDGRYWKREKKENHCTYYGHENLMDSLLIKHKSYCVRHIACIWTVYLACYAEHKCAYSTCNQTENKAKNSKEKTRTWREVKTMMPWWHIVKTTLFFGGKNILRLYIKMKCIT